MMTWRREQACGVVYPFDGLAHRRRLTLGHRPMLGCGDGCTTMVPTGGSTAMLVRKLLKVAWAAGLAACSIGGCECSRDVAVDEDTQIDLPPIVVENPEEPRPAVSFASECRQEDATLNKFIQDALTTCHRGDYDAFRQLFGTAYEPTSESDFKRVWRNVEEIAVCQVHAGKREPPHYYVLAKVRLRKADKKDRRERDIRIMVFQEGGRWRLGSAPSEVIDRMRAAASQPATDPAAEAFAQ